MIAFLAGMAAGYGIAIPVGAIAVLILDVALRRGFRDGFAAGAGAATADLLYAGLAGLAGELIAPAIQNIAGPLQLSSAAILLALGARGLWRASRSKRPAAAPAGDLAQGVGLYLQFLGLTLLNPVTIAYFAALIIGGAGADLNSLSARWLFVAGVALASLSWQTLLAAFGAAGHQKFSPRLRAITSVSGSLIVIGFGLWILVTWLT